jgi:hypothetical protein
MDRDANDARSRIQKLTNKERKDKGKKEKGGRIDKARGQRSDSRSGSTIVKSEHARQ